MKGEAELTCGQLDDISRVLADPRRFAMLRQIASTDELPCSAILEQHPLSPATISHHVKELSEVQLISTRREGRGLRLRLRRDTWGAYLRGLEQALAETEPPSISVQPSRKK